MGPDRSRIPIEDATRADLRIVVLSLFIALHLARVRARTADNRVNATLAAMVQAAHRRHRDTVAICIVIILNERGGPGRGVDIFLHTMDTCK